MITPKEIEMAQQFHQERIKESLRKAEMRRRFKVLEPPPPHRQALARLGDTLVRIGTRLQMADPRHQPAAKLKSTGIT
ncbi:MAG TPA: hypothetical protein VKY59_01245 [Spirillospora sp.]|nr:hypothetical protein [Spirillospora sp.]